MILCATYPIVIGLLFSIILREFLYPTMSASLLGMTPVNVAGPESFIGRSVAAYFEPPGTFFAGKVVSFEHPHDDDSIDVAAEGIWYKVRFDDQHEQDYNITELNNILIPVGKEYGQLSRYEWTKAKLSYDSVGLALREGTANPTDPSFLSKVFAFRNPGTVSAANIKSKLKTTAKYLHSDKTSRQPANVRYVATKLLEAQRFFCEKYAHINSGGHAPTINQPTAADFPAYGSTEFAERVSVDPDTLTQDPTNAPNNVGGGADTNGGGGGGANGDSEADADFGGRGVVFDDPDGNDLPVQPSAFTDPTFDVNSIVNDKSALDLFSFDDTFLCPFTTVLHVPSGAAEDWARTFANVTKDLLDACALPLADPSRRAKIILASKWYGILPQIILRSPGRGPEKDTKIIKLRLHQFVSGNFKSLVGHWAKDVQKQHARSRKPRNDTIEARTTRAVKDILDGDISRGLRITDGHGCTPLDDPAIRQQMKDKHPAPAEEVAWPPIPEAWIESVDMDLSYLEKIIHETDPKTGVGPRCLRPDHIKWLFEGIFEHPDAISAKDYFTELGSNYLSLKLPAWLRALLGGGLLTALNKNEPVPGQTPDARPVKAEDSDTSAWCKALGRVCTLAVQEYVAPQQFGVGVSGGVELYVHGFKILYEEAVRNNEEVVIVPIDIKNAHNDFPRQLAQVELIAAAHLDPRLIPLAVAHESTLRAFNSIYMRSNQTPSGYSHLCFSKKGGGQGNALTGLLYVINQNPALKETEARYAGCELKAIHDDMTLIGSPGQVWGENGCLTFLIKKLEERGLTVNLNKCSALGSTPGACSGKPVWLKEPTTILDKDNNIVHARGIEICKNPIGEDIYVKTCLVAKFESIRSAIQKSFEALLPSSSHAAYLSFYYSFQSRFDYLLSTNYLKFTGPLAVSADDFLRQKICGIAGFDIFTASPSISLPGFIERRISLKVKHGGLGFRRLSDRVLLLNSLNNTLLRAIDYKDEKNVTIKGLWNSLSRVLGPGSFDHANKDNCWAFFHSSGTTFGNDHRALITNVHDRYAEGLAALGKEPDSDCFLTCPAVSFGFGVPKLHKKIQDNLRTMEYELLLKDAKQLAGDDQRSVAFLATHDSEFANCFPVASDPNSKFDNREFETALARKMGAPVKFLEKYVGSRVRANGNSHVTVVDPYGNGVASAPGVPGDHPRQFHDRVVRGLVKQVEIAQVPVKGGHRGTCKNTFSKCYNPGDPIDEVDARLLQGIIPDMVVDARDCDAGPFTSPNQLVGRRFLVEHKTLASLLISVAARAKKILSDIKKRAEELDTRHPGSTFVHELGMYGEYVALVTGPFGNLSTDFKSLVDFIARERAMQTMKLRDIEPTLALAVHRRALVRRIGLLTTRGWAQLIVDRWRDAVSNRPAAPADIDLTVDETLFDNPHRGGYHSMHVSGA